MSESAVSPFEPEPHDPVQALHEGAETLAMHDADFGEDLDLAGVSFDAAMQSAKCLRCGHADHSDRGYCTHIIEGVFVECRMADGSPCRDQMCFCLGPAGPNGRGETEGT